MPSRGRVEAVPFLSEETFFFMGNLKHAAELQEKGFGKGPTRNCSEKFADVIYRVNTYALASPDLRDDAAYDDHTSCSA